GVTVGCLLDTEESCEVGCRGGIVSELQGDLPARRQMTEKDQKTGEEQTRQRVDDLGWIARIIDSRQVTIRRAKEVRGCCQCDVEQGLHLLLRKFKRSSLGALRRKRKKFGDELGVCSLLSMIRLGHSWGGIHWVCLRTTTQLLPRLCPECSTQLSLKVGNCFIDRPKNRQHEEIIDVVLQAAALAALFARRIVILQSCDSSPPKREARCRWSILAEER